MGKPRRGWACADINKCGVETAQVDGGVYRQKDTGRNWGGESPLDSYRSWYIWSQIPKRQERFSSFL